jgi:phage-related protein
VATILGLALKVTGDASGLAKSLDPVDKALASIGRQVETATKVFAPFTQASAAAAAAQQEFAARFAELSERLRAGAIGPEEYARAFAALKDEAKETAAIFGEAAKITERNRTEEDRRAETIARLDRALELGAINQREYNAEMIQATGVNEQIAAAERERAELSARAARVVEANLTASQRAQNTYNAELLEYQTLLRAGAISQADFNLAVERSAQSFAKATVEANKAGSAIDAAGKGGKLQFNELSGILSALPGPLGGVAGRISGLASAGEGLSRVFAGGLSAGISGVGASVAALVNPFTVGVAGVAAFGAAASAVASGLGQLSGTVEQLGFAARQAGVDFQTIQVLDEAATRAGVSVETLATGVQRFGARLSDAAKGSGETFTALQQLGFSLEEIQQGQRDPTEFAARVATALEQIPEPARQAQLQIDILGRGGESLVRAFSEIPGATVAIRQFGGAISDLDQNRLLELDGAFENVQRSVLGLGRELLTPFTGITQSISEGLAPTIAAFGRNIGAVLDIFSPLTSAVGAQINLFLQFGATVANLVGTILEPFAAVGRTIGQAFDGMSQAVTSVFASVNDTVLGFRSLFAFDGTAAKFGGTIASVASTVERLATIVTTAFGKLGEVIASTVTETVGNIGEMVGQFLEFTGLGDAIESIANLVAGIFGKIGEFFSGIAGGVGGFVSNLLDTAEGFLGIDNSAKEAADGVNQTTEAVQQLSAEQRKSLEEVQKAVEKSQGTLDTVIQKSAEFGQAGFDAALRFQDALADLQEQADSGELNAEQYSRGVALATAEYDRQIESIRRVQEETRKAAEESQRKAEADRSVADQLLEQVRIQEQFGGDAERARAAEAVLAVEREIAKVRESVAAARDNGDEQAVANGNTRIEQLQTIAKQQQAIADGSAQAAADEAKRLDDQRKRIDDLLAAGQEQTQIERDIIAVQEQQRLVQAELNDARLAQNTQDANAAVARLAQLDQLQAKLEEQQQAAEQGFGNGFAAAFEAVDRNIGQVIDKAAQFGNAGAEAAARLQQGIAAAQEQARDGILNAEAFDREVARQQEVFNKEIQNIEKADQLRKQKIDENAKLREQAEEQAVRNAEAAQQQQQQLVEQQRQQQQAIFQEQQRIAEERRQAEEAEFNRQQERLRQLNTLGSSTVNTADVRTAEGAALVLNLAGSAQDPALIEARLQTKALQSISQVAAQVAATYFSQFNLPVAIVGAARLG